jgi:hypothetical protein
MVLPIRASASYLNTIVTSHRSIRVIATIAWRIARGAAFILLGGFLILAFMLKSINRDGNVLIVAVPNQGQDHTIETQ